jgi:hypothetical protein
MRQFWCGFFDLHLKSEKKLHRLAEERDADVTVQRTDLILTLNAIPNQARQPHLISETMDTDTMFEEGLISNEKTP